MGEDAQGNPRQEEQESCPGEGQSCGRAVVLNEIKEAAKKMEGGIKEILIYCDFPGEYWIRIDDIVEQLNREIRGLTRVVGCFPDGNAAIMLAYTM